VTFDDEKTELGAIAAAPNSAGYVVKRASRPNPYLPATREAITEFPTA
jgi:hypothetical protein